jgi:Uma2 family endonuclease
MIASMQDLLVLTEQDYESLPSEDRWEVVRGRAVLLPPNDVEHQDISDELVGVLRTQLRSLRAGYAYSAVGVWVPPWPDAENEIHSRAPDIVVCKRKGRRYFPVGSPPELVIEVLATRRGNVERTEKLEDYARAGIQEYWVVDPFERCIEVYRLREGGYVLGAVLE